MWLNAVLFLSILFLQLHAHGPAVYKARSLYNLIYNTHETFTDDDCVPQGYSLRQGHFSDNNNLLPELKANEKQKVFKKTKVEYVLFPNPTIDKFSIRGNKEFEEIQIIITDISGRQLMNQLTQLANYKTSISLSLLNGIYFVTIINSKLERLTKKLVIVNTSNAP